MGKTHMNQLQKAALKRLRNDLKQIEKEPLIGVSAAPLDDDFFRWHVNLSGPSGTTYEGVAIHMELTFPENYPQSPPSASFYNEIPYHGGATKRDDKGRVQLCLNILADFAFVHTEWEHDRDASGWSSAYTVQTILLNLQAFLLDVPNRHDRQTEQFVKTANKFVCPDCGHK